MLLKVLTGLVLAILLMVAVGVVLSRRSQRRIDALSAALVRSRGHEVFEPAMVKDLPEPARRYLLHAIRPGTTLAFSAEVRMRGRLRLSPEQAWRELSASEIIAAERGFVWKASVGGLLAIHGFDRYTQGEGEMSWRLLGLAPVMAADGADVTRSARGRFAAELVFLPSALLPKRGVTWESIDADSARATVVVDGTPVELKLTIDGDGRLTRVVLDRWGNYQTPGGEWQSIPYAVTCDRQREFGGYTIATRYIAGWWADTERYFEYVEEDISEVIYH